MWQEDVVPALFLTDPSITVPGRIWAKVVCNKFYKRASALGNDTFDAIRKCVIEGVPYSPAKVAPRPRATDIRKTAVVKILTDLMECVAEKMPHESVLHPKDRHRTKRKPEGTATAPKAEVAHYIPGGLYPSKAAVYRDLLASNLISSDVSLRLFKKYWNTVFWFVSIRKWQPFAKCDECIFFRANILSGAPEESKQAVRSKQAAHRQEISLARCRGTLREELGALMGDCFLHVMLDAMDNDKTNPPHCRGLTHSKAVDQAGMPLEFRLYGVWSKGNGFLPFYTLPVYTMGANLTVSVLCAFLQKHYDHYKSLPPILMLQLDNTSKENKNNVRFSFFPAGCCWVLIHSCWGLPRVDAFIGQGTHPHPFSTSSVNVSRHV